jgi:Xaa-Pro dipeptidase
MRLTEPFYRRKVAAVQEALAARELDGLLLLNAHQLYYLIGFFHFPTERPVALFVPRHGVPVLFVPKLEDQYARDTAGWAPELEVYFEYPGIVHPLDFLAERLAARGYSKALLGLEGSMPVAARDRLARALPQVTWHEAGDIVAGLRLVKNPEEIALMRRAAGYADLMLEQGVAMLRSGERCTEIEVQQHMVSRGLDKMRAELDPLIVVARLADALVCSGPNSANPHGLPTSRRIVPGENLVLRVGCFVGGYFAESERTYFTGEPSAEQRSRYAVERDAQETGVQALQPGVRCCDVNRRCLDVIRAGGLGEYILHRMGHGVGVQNHEPPWVEDGDTTVLAPGMLVSSEPGIYCTGQGGYSISDTVLVTAQGPERITYFPRDLESVVIPL